MKPILLELGGKDAAIVLEDANLDKLQTILFQGHSHIQVKDVPL
ncbi:NADP-dependent glyceraldehyde-3-phosphate dehydrogenase [Streptobacillus moniliformis]|nr:NADP-dependent glyceraldehyde-3-phosphate dehydrogenase [Streptobacillus moniliformis]